jgi:gluconokinase
VIIIVMGVTGSGKTTVGERLAADLGWRFHDADDFHSPANKAKMHAGLPLTDEDRWPWLDAIHDALERDVADHVSAVVACSALREAYRQRLERGLPDVGLVLLDGDPAILASRLSHRTDHFMNPALLQSQIDTLERPSHAVIVDISKPVGVQVSLIREAFGI